MLFLSGLSQRLFGDPSLTSGKVGLSKMEAGGGLVSGQELREKGATTLVSAWFILKLLNGLFSETHQFHLERFIHNP
jgi:hypothetical protein